MLLKEKDVIARSRRKTLDFAILRSGRARSPDFWDPVDPIGVQRPDFVEFALSEMTKILRLRLRMTADGLRITAWKSFSAACKRPRFATMYQKRKWLAMDSENPARIYVIEKK